MFSFFFFGSEDIVILLENKKRFLSILRKKNIFREFIIQNLQSQVIQRSGTMIIRFPGSYIRNNQIPINFTRLALFLEIFTTQQSHKSIVLDSSSLH